MMRRATRLLVLLAWLALGAALQARPVRPVLAGAAVRVVATVDLAHPGRTIPQSFLGLSIETYIVPLFTGTPATGANPAFVQLLQNLSAYGGGAPVLRIGGNSGDESWWNPTGLPGLPRRSQRRVRR